MILSAPRATAERRGLEARAHLLGRRAKRYDTPVRLASLLLALWVLGASTAVHAQDMAPQACGQSEADADYGTLRVGSIVVPQRHRFVGGDPNWDERMARFIGRVARVTQLSGVDARGCPGVRLDIDGGRFFWRTRDLNVGAERPSRIVESGDDLPQACARTDENATFGPLRVGTAVVLGRHRAVDGDDNWVPAMRAFVGRVARVTQLVGTDDRGCAGVHVDVDGGQWFWRVRDLRLAEEGENESVAIAPGLAAEHGRPAPSTPADNDPRIVQACGQDDARADYGTVTVGTEVVLGRHRPVDGVDNWVEPMDAYVGRRARVVELIGVDEQGCPLLRVDVDHGDWYWRLRDVQLP